MTITEWALGGALFLMFALGVYVGHLKARMK